MDSSVEDKIKNFFISFPQKTYKEGDLLIKAGENPSGIFFIKEGLVRQYSISRDGENVILNEFKKGSFFPMSWALTNENNKYFYESIGTTHINRAPKEDVVKFVKENTDVLFNLLTRVYKGTNGLLQRLEYLMTETAYRQLIFILILYAKRFGEKSELGSIIINIDENELASYTGMARETISRQLKILKHKNLITVKSKALLIPDLNKIEDELID